MPRTEDTIIPELIEPKYPGFDNLAIHKQVEILSTELAINPGVPIDILLPDIGCSQETYVKITLQKGWGDKLRDKCKAIQMTPHMAKIFQTTALDAADGDPAKLKIAMQMYDVLTPETQTIINQNLLHMERPQLIKEMEQTLEEAKELQEYMDDEDD